MRDGVLCKRGSVRTADPAARDVNDARHDMSCLTTKLSAYPRPPIFNGALFRGDSSAIWEIEDADTPPFLTLCVFMHSHFPITFLAGFLSRLLLVRPIREGISCSVWGYDEDSIKKA